MQCFIIFSDEIEGRLDCFFYQSEFLALEKKVKSCTDKTLADYVVSIAGGATPEKDESNKYYSDSRSGIPFLRVQNVIPAGLQLDDCKFINKETHNGMLKRSQVKAHDLITKITGVGRMAVSAVAPAGFEGNINQHLVVIRTDGQMTSKVLAAFLNSNVGERLAFRRSTGGTRPALDYEALQSIPIIFKPEVVEIMNLAYERKRQYEKEAEKLAHSIQQIVLKVLGIKLPEHGTRRCYTAQSTEVEGWRIDPTAHHPNRLGTLERIRSSGLTIYPLKKLVEFKRDLVTTKTPSMSYVGLENIESNTGTYIPSNDEKMTFDNAFQFSAGDILFPKLRPYLNKVHLAKFNGVCSTEFHILHTSGCNTNYLFFLLNSPLVLNQITYLMTGNTLPRLQTEDVENLLIPVPSKKVQNAIVREANERASEVRRLKNEAGQLVEQAKQQAEKLILNG